MADTPDDWRTSLGDTFSWTVLFRTFRLAVQPGKLAFATLGLLLTFLVGWVLDGLWSAAGVAVVPREPAAFVTQPDFADYKAGRLRALNSSLAQLLVRYNVSETAADALTDLDTRRGESVEALREEIDRRFGGQIDLRERENAERGQIN